MAGQTMEHEQRPAEDDDCDQQEEPNCDVGIEQHDCARHIDHAPNRRQAGDTRGPGGSGEVREGTLALRKRNGPFGSGRVAAVGAIERRVMPGHVLARRRRDLRYLFAGHPRPSPGKELVIADPIELDLDSSRRRYEAGKGFRDVGQEHQLLMCFGSCDDVDNPVVDHRKPARAPIKFHQQFEISRVQEAPVEVVRCAVIQIHRMDCAEVGRALTAPETRGLRRRDSAEKTPTVHRINHLEHLGYDVLVCGRDPRLATEL